jgi:hypothetical protein
LFSVLAACFTIKIGWHMLWCHSPNKNFLPVPTASDPMSTKQREFKNPHVISHSLPQLEYNVNLVFLIVMASRIIIIPTSPWLSLKVDLDQI